MGFRVILVLSFVFSFRVFADTERLVPFSSAYAVNEKMPKHEILDMPPDSSQDTLGICFAEVAAKMMQKENCEYLKAQRPNDNISCSTMSERQLFAPLDLARMQIKDGAVASAARSSYSGLNVYGGSLINAIRFGALVVKQTANKACVSLDRILSKIDSRSDAEAIQRAIWERLENDFKKVKAEAENYKGCDDCLSRFYETAAKEYEPSINKDLNLKKDNLRLAEAFAKDTYAEFLNQLLGTAKCLRPTELVSFEPHDKVDYVHFPKNPGERTDKATVMEKIKAVIRNGRPVALNGICYDDVKPDNCDKQKFHAVVVAGYRTVCNQQGICKESIKVINSKGKSWQDANDQGWIDANTVLDHTSMVTGVVSWFEDKK